MPSSPLEAQLLQRAQSIGPDPYRGVVAPEDVKLGQMSIPSPSMGAMLAGKLPQFGDMYQHTLDVASPDKGLKVALENFLLGNALKFGKGLYRQFTGNQNGPELTRGATPLPSTGDQAPLLPR